MNERDNIAGYEDGSREYAILKFISEFPKSHTGELVDYFTSDSNRSGIRMARGTLLKKLEQLTKEKAIDKVVASHKNTVYYLHGFRPILSPHPDPTELDQFIVDEAKKIIAKFLDGGPGITLRNNARWPYGTEDGDNEPAKAFERHLIAVHGVVRQWEYLRDVKVPRPWIGPRPGLIFLDSSMPLTLIPAPDSEAYGQPGRHAGRFAIGKGVELMPAGVKNAEDPIKPAKKSLKGLGSSLLSGPVAWYNFYMAVIETVSRYIQEHKRKTKVESKKREQKSVAKTAITPLP